MTPLSQLVVAAVSAGLPTLTVLASLLINNQRLSDLTRMMEVRFAHVDTRMADLGKRIDDVRGEMLRMEQVIDARLKHLEEYLER